MSKVPMYTTRCSIERTPSCQAPSSKGPIHVFTCQGPSSKGRHKSDMRLDGTTEVLIVLRFACWVSGLGFQVSGLGFRVSDCGLRVSDFRFRVSGCGSDHIHVPRGVVRIVHPRHHFMEERRLPPLRGVLPNTLFTHTSQLIHIYDDMHVIHIYITIKR